MKTVRNKKLIFFFVESALILIAISGFIYITNYKMYAISFVALLLIDLILLIIYLKNTKSAQDRYRSNIKYILRTFDSVLAYLDCDIDFKKREIIKVSSFDDLVNCQEELKKPILYSYNNEAAIFFVIDVKTVYYTTIKVNEKIIHPLEEEISKASNSKEEPMDDSLLEDIDKTTIILTRNNKKYKVSPIKKEPEELEKTEELSLTKALFFPKSKNE